jgi:hypothetical protein
MFASFPARNRLHFVLPVPPLFSQRLNSKIEALDLEHLNRRFSQRERTVNQSRPQGIVIAAVLMIVFGVAEVKTGLTHRFFSLSTARVAASAYAGATIGILYVVAGLLILSMKRWAAATAIALLIADIIGRVAMVVTGLYPVDSVMQTLAIILGTSIVAVFAVYIKLKWSSFA